MKAMAAVDKRRISRESILREACERDGGRFSEQRGLIRQARRIQQIPTDVVICRRLEWVDDDVGYVARANGAERLTNRQR